MNYRFRTARQGALRDTPALQFEEKEPEPLVKPIQGRMPDSKEEFYVAMALYKLGHSFIYQYQVFGGTGIRGGQIVDFLVRTTVPRSTLIQVYGKYWHSGEMGSEDKFKLAQLENEFAGQADVLVLWAKDVPTIDDAYTLLRGKIGEA